MLNRDGNKNDKKNNKSKQQKKTNFARAAHFFCTFLCRCIAPTKGLFT